MNLIDATTLAAGTANSWLTFASAGLATVMAFAMLRYRALYRAAREEQNNSRDLIENLSEGIYRSSPDGRQLSANKALVKLNGYPNEAAMLEGVKDIGKEWYVEPGRRDEFRRLLRRDGKVEDFISEVYRHKTRERIWITESARLVNHRKTGKPLFYEGSVREITETIKRLNLEERFRKLTEQLPGGLFQFAHMADGTSRVLFVSDGCLRITGLPADCGDAFPARFFELVHPDDRAGYQQSIREAAERREQWNHEFRLRSLDGQEKWVRISARPEAQVGSVVWHGYFSDVSARKTQEMEIAELAYYDPLTTLPNRRLFLKRMAQVVSGCDLRGNSGALLFIDLDNFKTLNDTQGHDVGDRFLLKVAQRLKACLREHDMVSRIGGDEFVVIVEDAGPDNAHATRHAINLANRILAELNGGFELGVVKHVGSASIGVVVFDGRAKGADELLKQADVAMYQAKASGRNRLALFEPATLARETDRYKLLGDLREAILAGELQLHYQLQVDHSRMVIGAEALVRWQHPTRGMILPDVFVPLAEQYGLNDDLTRIVFELGFETLARWQGSPSTAHLRLALNVSVQSFATCNLETMLKDLILRTGVDASKLTIELTERVMAKDHAQMAARMRELKGLGIRLSLDDFGTGYSSLAYLKMLPFDELKIDGSFVADIETAESDRALIKTILAMAGTLGLSTVGEHVENVRQEAFLRAFGCDYLQGYLYGPAVPLEDLFREQPSNSEARLTA